MRHLTDSPVLRWIGLNRSYALSPRKQDRFTTQTANNDPRSGHANGVAGLLNSPRSLDGCSTEAGDALTRLQIHTVFELGMSSHFQAASFIAYGEHGVRFGPIPAGLLDDPLLHKGRDELAGRSVEALDGIGEAYAALLGEHLGVHTVQDMAEWPPFLQAARLVSKLIADPPSASLDEREGVPNELVPSAGRGATEKRRYRRVFLDSQLGSDALSEFEGLLSLSDTVGPQARFTDVAFGALLTFEQSWTPQEIVLGQLLHSLALAPAEMTKVAIVDWTRSTSAELSESADQRESLANTSRQSRSVEEVADATAREIQEGSSATQSSSRTSQYGASAGGPGFGLSSVAASSLQQIKASSPTSILRASCRCSRSSASRSIATSSRVSVSCSW